MVGEPKREPDEAPAEGLVRKWTIEGAKIDTR